MSRYRLAIFDADGTLFDSLEGIYASIRHTIGEMGLRDLSDEEMRLHIGPPVDEAYRRSFGISGDVLEETVRCHREFNTEHGVVMSSVFPGIADMLDALKSRGILTAVASLKPSETLARMIGIHGLAFDSVHGYSGTETKGDLIRMCMSDLGCAPGETVMVGDTVNDEAGAESAGTDFIPVSYGYGFGEGGDTADSPEQVLERIIGVKSDG